MRPITSPASLTEGATLYHSAFGFAQVTEVADDEVALGWDRDGTHLPQRVSWSNLARAYALCPPQGFFHRALRDPEGLLRVLHGRPADGVVWLLEDLGTALAVRDVMDWTLNRGLFTAKTFVRWWAAAETVLRGDIRLAWEDDWVRLRSPESGDIRQLEPGLVETTQAPTIDDELDVLAPDEDSTEEDQDTDVDAFLLPEPRTLAETRLPGTRMLFLARRVAQALAEAHAAAGPVDPRPAATVVQPDGRVTFSRGPAAGTATEADDVRAVARGLCDALLGRALGDRLETADLLPFLRHRVRDLPPTALGPLAAALRPSPEDRPTASAWVDLWDAALASETARRAATDDPVVAIAGYDSHIGHVKLLHTQTNQDCLTVTGRDSARLFVVADGISVCDVGRGDIASNVAVKMIARTWEATLDRGLSARRVLDRALKLANRAVCEQSLKIAKGELTGRTPMGTTCTVALFDGRRVQLAWLGDSRAYLVGPSGASLLTADDNVSGERLNPWADGDLPAWSPNAHALVRYLGHFDQQSRPAPLPPHSTSFDLLEGERLVICSDGVTDYIHGHEAEVSARIDALTRSGPIEDAARALVNLSNAMGGGDNITAVVIELEQA